MTAPTTVLRCPAGQNSVSTAYGSYTASGGLVTVDSRAVPALIGAGFIPYDSDVPVGKTSEAGSHTVTSGEGSAHTCSIATGLTSVVGYGCLVLRAGVAMSSASISVSGGNIIVADNGSTYVLTAGDVIVWTALGVL